MWCNDRHLYFVSIIIFLNDVLKVLVKNGNCLSSSEK